MAYVDPQRLHRAVMTVLRDILKGGEKTDSKTLYDRVERGVEAYLEDRPDERARRAEGLGVSGQGTG